MIAFHRFLAPVPLLAAAARFVDSFDSDSATRGKRQIRCGLEALLGIFLQTAMHDTRQSGRSVCRNLEMLGGSSFRIALIVSAGVDLWKARLPVSIS